MKAEIIIFTIFSMILGEVFAKCPVGWYEYRAAKKCFYIMNKRGSLVANTNLCQDLNGTLISIHSAEENEFVRKIAFEENLLLYAWLGLKKNGVEYQWADGTEVDYSNWARYEPSCKKGCGFEMRRDGYWYSYTINQEIEQICQKMDESNKNKNNYPQLMSDLTDLNKKMSTISKELKMMSSSLKQVKNNLNDLKTGLDDEKKNLTMVWNEIIMIKEGLIEINETLNDGDDGSLIAEGSGFSNVDEIKESIYQISQSMDNIQSDVGMIKKDNKKMQENQIKLEKGLNKTQNFVDRLKSAFDLFTDKN